MHSLTSIVARNADGVIGVSNRLPWRLRTDMRFFRDTTVNNVVIMGRKTYDSLGGCLPRRSNVIVSHGFSLFASSADCRSVSGIDEALFSAHHSAGKRKSVFVVGGSTMYRQFSPFVDRYLVTEVQKKVSDGDTFFDERDFIGDSSLWECRVIAAGEANNEGDEVNFQIFEYVSKFPETFRQRRAEILTALQSRTENRFHSVRYAPAVA